ncbi:5674_t:CDS:1 [Ambispora gerdemannii]|uniref:5674_t:CDS:1 n=1 Tax=Ambispora gerdemannii TaxID=144530 RepID=A0A9N9FQ69_9GLOM|nr:5674_t:CDS:1 [Ambispora gerdemannii]
MVNGLPLGELLNDLTGSNDGSGNDGSGTILGGVPIVGPLLESVVGDGNGATGGAKPLTDAANGATGGAKPVTDAANGATGGAKPVTDAVNGATGGAAKPVTGATK